MTVPEILRRQVHATFQDDPVGIANVAYTGSDALIWGSDYPHEEGTYPNSRRGYLGFRLLSSPPFF